MTLPEPTHLCAGKSDKKAACGKDCEQMNAKKCILKYFLQRRAREISLKSRIVLFLLTRNLVSRVVAVYALFVAMVAGTWALKFA